MSDEQMIEQPVVTDEGVQEQAVVENADDSAVAELQERMGDDTDDAPWYSASEGKVVTASGEVVKDDSGNAYDSIEAYQAAQKATDTPAKPKTEEAQQTKEPMSQSFDRMINGEGEMTTDKLFEMSKSSEDYKYGDELVLKIDPSTNVQGGEEVDPVEAVKAEREILVGHMLNPINEIAEILVAQGADGPQVAQLLAPVLKKQNDAIAAHHEGALQKAMEAKIGGPVEAKLSAAERKQQGVDSKSNIERLAKMYYPEGGTDAFFALINGHYETNDKGQKEFVRGPAAEVLDLLSFAANNGQAHKTGEKRNSFVKNTFERMTANPDVARSFMNIAHFFWLGRQAKGLQQASFDKGQESAQQQANRVKQTVKTSPSTFNPPSSDDEGMPAMLKTVMKSIQNQT